MKKLINRFLMMALIPVAFAGCTDEEPEETTSTPATVVCPSTVTDIEGNTYTVLKIGNKCWMLSNLKTTRYNDGVPISTGLSASAWENATAGAYAMYDDNSANVATYGLLYNGFAVTTGKLCPAGWHIPSDLEWKELETALGMPSSDIDLTGERGYNESIGGKMKSLILWDSPNSGASNSSGFDGLPAGIRNGVGDYIVKQQAGYFWSSSVYATDNNYLWFRNLYYQATGIYRNFTLKHEGYSCRCVKD